MLSCGLYKGPQGRKIEPSDRMVTNLLGLAMLGWGVGKLSVRRGYERVFMQMNMLPMVGSLAVAGKRFGPTAFWCQAVTAGLYAVIGFKPQPQIGRAHV